MMLGFSVCIASVLVVVLGGWLAYRDSMLYPDQMRKESYPACGLPFLGHGGMWGDLLVISPILGIITGEYGSTWSGGDMFRAFAIGTFMSLIMHLLYRTSKIRESHVQGGHLTMCGWVHFVYMSGALGVILLFYFWTPNPSRPFMILVSYLLTLHVACANHIPLSLMKPAWFPGNSLRDPIAWCTIGGCAVALTARTVYLVVG